MADKVSLTPSKRGNTNVLRLERIKTVDNAAMVHEGKGLNRGLVVNHATAALDETVAPHLQLEFKCWLIHQHTGERVPERRQLKFWFKSEANYLDRVSLSYEFFRELVQPENFPRDYLNFIKKCMKQMKSDYFVLLQRVDVELTTLDLNVQDNLIHGVAGMEEEQDTRTAEEKLREQVLYCLESAYPNVLGVEDITRITGATEPEVMAILQELASRGLVQKMENQDGWVRRVQMAVAEGDDPTLTETEPQVVQQMPTSFGKNQPTIAVITANYYEKLAVDSMMEKKTTYVRFQTQGDAHVYTLGYIGDHMVVSTKLPQIGRTRGAKISSGNNTTRLLGTFGQVEHVFLVGTAGGVPHYTDYYKHVRLGDVVTSTTNEKGFLYVFCDEVTEDRQTKEISYVLKTYTPKDFLIQEKVKEVRDYCEANPASSPWFDYITEGQHALRGQEVSFERPPVSSDKLFMSLGEQDVIEVAHPTPPEGKVTAGREGGTTVMRYGAVGSGRAVIRGAAARQEFAYKYNLMAFDNEFDQVLDSVIGNVKYSFCLIRGIIDYMDGMSNNGKKWLPYSALAAAAYMKTIIKSMPNV